ncbi:MAG: flagellar biosynthesis anti-sigma factor FlgM [bacterium]|nr:flagellar biosynthesis anti-sigma factor FlgM [bacterium]
MPNRIDNVPPSPESKRTQRTEPGGTGQTDRPESTLPAGDSVEISGTAQQAQAEQNRLQDAARGIPDIREDRVAQARERLANGEFESDEIRRIIADRLLDQFGV